ARRHGPLLYRPQRLARHAIEDEQEAVLRRLRDDVDAPAFVRNGQELRRGREVVVPEIVMHGLEVPEPLARAHVERDETVAEQIRADAIRAVIVVGRRAERDIDDAALDVERHLAPRVDAADVEPGVLRPRVVAELAGLRTSVESPDELARHDVVRADVTRRREEPLARRRAEHDQVLEHAPRRLRLHAANGPGIAAEPDAEIHGAAVAEINDAL